MTFNKDEPRLSQDVEAKLRQQAENMWTRCSSDGCEDWPESFLRELQAAAAVAVEHAWGAHPLANVYKCEGKHCQAAWIRRPIGRDDINSNEAVNHGWTHGEWHDDKAEWLCPHCSVNIPSAQAGPGMTMEERAAKIHQYLSTSEDCDSDELDFVLRHLTQAVTEAVAAERERGQEELRKARLHHGHAQQESADSLAIEAEHWATRLEEAEERHAAELTAACERNAELNIMISEARQAALEEAAQVADKQKFRRGGGTMHSREACDEIATAIRQLAAAEKPEGTIPTKPGRYYAYEITSPTSGTYKAVDVVRMGNELVVIEAGCLWPPDLGHQKLSDFCEWKAADDPIHLQPKENNVPVSPAQEPVDDNPLPLPETAEAAGQAQADLRGSGDAAQDIALMRQPEMEDRRRRILDKMDRMGIPTDGLEPDPAIPESRDFTVKPYPCAKPPKRQGKLKLNCGGTVRRCQ